MPRHATNPTRSPNPLMRIRKLLLATLAGTLLAACVDLEVTDPNRQSSDSFWRTANDAERGLTASYNALQLLGVYSRWHVFAHDERSDIGTGIASPNPDIGNFGAFILNDYNEERNRELWTHNYELVGRANQVIANVPGIEMDAALRGRIVAEAKFLRALGYWNLVTLYDNIPLLTAPPAPGDRPGPATPAATYAQIEQDLVDAAAVLPESYADAGDRARPTRYSALAMLGKVRLQMAGVLDMPAKWGEASTVLGQVITSNRYSLLPNYADNFVLERDFTNPESIFEVSNEDMWPVGVTGISFPKMVGPCYRPGGPLDFNPAFCDVRPTRWYFNRFMESTTTTGGVDPRLDVTILYSSPARAGEMVYGRTRGSYFVNVPGGAQEDTMLFFRKYGETQLNADQRWDNPINYKVVRYADVLLMQAEALNENNQPGAAGLVNQVRARVGKGAVAGLTQAQMRDTILFERMFEFGLEASRWNDLRRQDRLDREVLRLRDRDFDTFEAGKSERLPIPTIELNRNPAMRQNPGW